MNNKSNQNSHKKPVKKQQPSLEDIAEEQSKHTVMKKTLPVPKWFEIKKGEKYAWSPVEGNSMTDDTNGSIPEGSLVLCRELDIKSIVEIPLDRPLKIMALEPDGKTIFCVLKTVCFIDNVFERLRLRSYNPSSEFKDWWIPARFIKKVFMVELVQRPNNTHFIPESKMIGRDKELSASALLLNDFLKCYRL